MSQASGGPREKRKRWHEDLPEYDVASSRRPLGPVVAPQDTSPLPKAVEARRLRNKANPGYLVIRSQLQLARKRSDLTQNPCRAQLLEASVGKSRDYRVGESVLYIRPGGRRIAMASKGFVLAFPDAEKKWVAVDRSHYVKKGSLLKLIDVVPREDAWLP